MTSEEEISHCEETRDVNVVMRKEMIFTAQMNSGNHLEVEEVIKELIEYTEERLDYKAEGVHTLKRGPRLL